MNPPMLCPACLTELANDYPYDHVAIDRALTTQPERLAEMDLQQRREVVLTGLARGVTITALAAHFSWTSVRIRSLLPTDHPESVANARHRNAMERAELDTSVHVLWNRGLPDTEIALRTGRSVYVIADTRRRLNLATLASRHGLLSGGAR